MVNRELREKRIRRMKDREITIRSWIAFIAFVLGMAIMYLWLYSNGAIVALS